MGQRVNIDTHAGYKGDVGSGIAYYDIWRDIEGHTRALFSRLLTASVIYHVAPIMNAEMHRRLIGNDIGIVFFLEVGALFDPKVRYWFTGLVGCILFLQVLEGLGSVPQIFAIVQPFKNKYKYVR